ATTHRRVQPAARREAHPAGRLLQEGRRPHQPARNARAFLQMHLQLHGRRQRQRRRTRGRVVSGVLPQERPPLHLPRRRAVSRQHARQRDGRHGRTRRRGATASLSGAPRLVPAGHCFVIGGQRTNQDISEYWGQHAVQSLERVRFARIAISRSYRPSRRLFWVPPRPTRATFRPSKERGTRVTAEGGPMRAITRELRFAARRLTRAPAFSLASMLTLALGIGATTSI